MMNRLLTTLRRKSPLLRSTGNGHLWCVQWNLRRARPLIDDRTSPNRSSMCQK